MIEDRGQKRTSDIVSPFIASGLDSNGQIPDIPLEGPVTFLHPVDGGSDPGLEPAQSREEGLFRISKVIGQLSNESVRRPVQPSLHFIRRHPELAGAEVADDPGQGIYKSSIMGGTHHGIHSIVLATQADDPPQKGQ